MSRVSEKSRGVKRENRRWLRQRPITRGGNDHFPFVIDGVVPGEPGEFLPFGATPPANLAALQALGDLNETTAWDTDQYVELGDASSAHWDGDSWAAGAAP